MAISCTSCGTDLADGAAFCAECGAAAAASVAPLAPPPPWPMQPPAHPPTPASHPPTAYPNPVPAPDGVGRDGNPRNTVGGVLGLMGAVLVGVASFLAWGQITLAVVADRNQTVSGWDWFDNSVATGPLFAVLALVAAALSGLVFAQIAPPAVRIVVVAVGALGLGLAAFAVSDILRRESDLQSLGRVDVSLQFGIWLLVAGALFILASGFVATDARRPTPV